MNDGPSSSYSERESETSPSSWWRRLTQRLAGGPRTREDLNDLLDGAHESGLVDSDAASMIRGVFETSQLQVRDIMVPRAQMDTIDISQPIEEWLPLVLRSGHSRFPVIDGDRDRVAGILLAKDLLRYFADQAFDVRGMLRPAVFIPESKRLNVLLRDFRANRNHIAIVVDEFGGVAGLVTIEDVLEQIVGDIEDEHDYEEVEDNILPAEHGRWRVRALTEIEQFNEVFGTSFPDDDADTVGGLVSDFLGRVPRRGEEVRIDNIRFQVLRADGRQLHLLLVEKAAPQEPDAG